MLAVYALLLAAWGVWHARRAAAPAQPALVEAPEVEPSVGRGDAARRLLNTLS